MAPTEEIARILQQRQQLAFQTNPYLAAGGSMAANPIQPTNDRYGRETVTSGIARALQGITAGGLQAYGVQQANQDFNNYSSGLGQIMMQPRGQRGAAAVNDPRYSQFAPSLIQDDLEQTDKINNMIFNANIGAAANAQFSPDPQVRQLAAQFGGVVPQQQQQPQMAQPAAQPQTDAMIQEIQGMQQQAMQPSPGTATPTGAGPIGIPQRQAQIYQQMSQQMPTDAAVAGSTAFMKPEYAAVEDEYKKMNEGLSAANAMINTGAQLAEISDSAGDLGIFPAAAEMMDKVNVRAFSDRDAQQRLAARKLINEKLPELIGAARANLPAAGTMDRSELQLYQNASVSAGDDPVTRKLAAEALVERGKLMRDQNTAKQNWFNKYQTFQGFENAWGQYLAASGNYTPVVETPQGLAINRNRLDPAQFFGYQPTQQQQPRVSLPQQPAPQQPQQTPQQPMDLRQAQTQVESSGNPNAVSPKGATGLRQVMPATGREVLAKMGLVAPDTPLDRVQQLLMIPEINNAVADAYLAEQKKNFGSDELALAAYNAGPNAVKKYGGVPPYKETQDYIRKINKLVGTQSAQAQTPAAQPQPAPTPTPTPTPQVMTASAQPPPGSGQQQGGGWREAFKDYVYDPAGQLLQGASFNFGDEIVGGLRAQLDGTNPYEEAAKERASVDQYAADNPNKALALQLAGGLISPVPAARLPGAIKGLASGAKISMLPKAAKVAAALPAKSSIVKTAIKGGAAGATMGAAYGAGGGVDERSRIRDAGKGAFWGGALGTAAAPVIKVTGDVLEYGAKQLAPYVPSMSRPLQGEAGKVGIGTAEGIPLSRAGMEVMRSTEGATAQDYQKALQRIIDTNEKRGGQMILPEALDNAALMGRAKLAGTEQVTKDIAKATLDPRSKDAAIRTKGAFDVVSKEASALKGAESIQKAIGRIEKAEEMARKKVSDPLFAQARKEVPVLNSPKMKQILKIGEVKRAISHVKDQFKNQKMPENSTQVVQSAMSWLSAEIKQVKRGIRMGTGSKNKSDLANMVQAYSVLKKEAYKLNPRLQEARETFAKGSTFLNELDSSQAKVIARMRDNNLVKASSEVFGMQAEQIAKLRNMVHSREPAAWNDMIKSHVIRIVDNTTDKKNLTMVNDLIGSPAGRDKLKAALGDELYDQVFPLLDAERTYANTFNTIYGNSHTQPMMSAKERTTAIRKLFDVVSSPTALKNKALDYAFRATPDDKLDKEIAEILFNSQKGREFLEWAIPTQGKIDSFGRIVRTGTEGAQSATRTAISQRSTARTKNKRNP